MGDENERCPSLADIVDLVAALYAEARIPDCQYLVDDEKLRVGVDGACKSKPHPHARRIGAERGVDAFADLRKIDDRVVARSDFIRGHPKKRHIEVDVLRATEAGFKACAESQHGCDLATGLDRSGCRVYDPGYQAKQGGLAAAIDSDKAK
ncbi:hypothetical protein LZK76_04575 [Rhizobium leguminosarum]|nr:hypothetical protein LZK76_04575 [Rhizobium leguminosarum]